MTAPMLITLVGNDEDVFVSAMKVVEGFRHARAADARERPAWHCLTRIVLPPSTRARAFE
eukprot:1714524-Pyramimonas_sp.AAC.1